MRIATLDCGDVLCVVSFAVKNGAHCGDDAWLRKGQVRRSHSPPQAALIAGIFPAPSNSSDSCLIRRYKRRSLRECRYSLSVTVPVVSHSLPQAALIAGPSPWSRSPAPILSHSPSKTALIAGALRECCNRRAEVSFAVKNGAHCGMTVDVQENHFGGLTRRHKRRSLRIQTDRSGCRSCPSHSPRPAALIAVTTSGTTPLVQRVSFAATSGAHCGTGWGFREMLEELSHSPSRRRSLREIT